MPFAGYDHLLRAAEKLRWDERPLDLAGDAVAFAASGAAEQAAVRRLVAGFCVAESAVATELGPFVTASEDPALRACFEAQADDERRHARFFGRVAAEVCGIEAPRALADPAVLELFEERLPARAAALAAGECGLADAVALYHLVLEGIVFAAGQEALLALVADLPAVCEGVLRVQGDERWHVGLGVTCLADAGLEPEAVEALLAEAAGAARAWGADVIGEAQVAHALELHRRRLAAAGLVPRERPISA